jgi:hypothetical protein
MPRHRRNQRTVVGAQRSTHAATPPMALSLRSYSPLCGEPPSIYEQ